MPEAVRLVVWDLDETFWKGTLTEGGITYNNETNDIVIELAKRGIMSTICSKNDLETVKKILVEKGIWDYFVFPSINWEPKGPRLAALVDAVQLRPETLMLIDDNPMNLNEAKHFVEGIQVSDEKIIPQLLGNPLFKGKNDSELSRLKQYKLLERRKADEAVASSATGNNYDFLRKSNVRVILEHDIEKHIDRAIELVNRTNQLNFTKIRLPENPEKAREKLRVWIGRTTVQAGLVRVVDNYGDYGFCGFYLMRNNHKGASLQQFAFSCRILNMGIEAWLYRFLGRPELEVTGEVLSDPKDERIPADWVRLVDSTTADAGNKAGPQVSAVFLRGGCDMRAFEHYIGQITNKVVGELNFVRDGLMMRIDHTSVVRHAVDGLDAQTLADFCKLGYAPEDFSTPMFDNPPPDACWVFSFWRDANLRVYRHKTTGKLIPVVRAPGPELATDPIEKLVREWKSAPDMGPERATQIMTHLRDNFESVGVIDDRMYVENLEAILAKVPKTGRVFLILGTEKPETQWAPVRIRHNELVRGVAAKFPNATVVPMDQFADPSESRARDHFDRMAYFRLFEYIRSALKGAEGAQPQRPAEQGAAPARRRRLAEAVPA